MAQRPIWRCHLRLALVSCPVALYTAKHDRGNIHFNLINPDTGNRIRMITQDAETDQPLNRGTSVMAEVQRNCLRLPTRLTIIAVGRSRFNHAHAPGHTPRSRGRSWPHDPSHPNGHGLIHIKGRRGHSLPPEQKPPALNKNKAVRLRGRNGLKIR
jgi:hypothetical protein